MRRLSQILFVKTDGENTAKSGQKISVKFIILGFVLTFFGVTGGAAYLEQDVLKAEFHNYAVERGFTPQIIEIKGRNQTPKDDILKLVAPLKNQSILALDLGALREDILSLGWVSDATIIRTLPNRLELRLTERQPAALLQTPKGHRLIDQDGVIIDTADAAEFGHLVVVSGQGAAKKAAVILDILRTEPDLFSEVWAVQHISERRWNVHMRSGLEIKLPENDPVLAWSRLALLEQETAITTRDLAAIDLRVPGQLIVEPNIPVRGKGRKT